MKSLEQIVTEQRAATAAHRERLGIGEFKPITGAVIWHNTKVECKDNTGAPILLEGCTVHIDRSMVAIWYGAHCSMLRRLGAPGFKIDGK